MSEAPPVLELFDSHCHLDSPELAGDVAGVLARARQAGVRYLCNIGSGYGPEEAGRAVKTAEAHRDVFAAIGVHPHDAVKAGEETLATMKALARSRKVVCWGEIGLDYHYQHSPPEVQRDLFRRQIEIALDLDLPISLHVREAALDTMVILRDVKAEAGDHLRGVWHCFTEAPDRALEAVELGFYISIPGIVTFPKGENVRAAVRAVPLEKLLVETDSPYLAPVPHRGKTNEPAFVLETARAIAGIKSTTVEAVARATTANARSAYELDRDRD